MTTENQEPRTPNKWWNIVKTYPQYIIACLIVIAGIFYPMPDSSMIPTEYLKTWALIVFALGCFFPFFISVISSRQQRHSGKFSIYAIIQLISLFSLAFGLGAWIAKYFQLDFFNIAFLAYGLGGYIGVLINKLLSKKGN